MLYFVICSPSDSAVAELPQIALGAEAPCRYCAALIAWAGHQRVLVAGDACGGRE